MEASHSGSTLLAMLLGSHLEAATIGDTGDYSYKARHRSQNHLSPADPDTALAASQHLLILAAFSHGYVTHIDKQPPHKPYTSLLNCVSSYNDALCIAQVRNMKTVKSTFWKRH